MLENSSLTFVTTSLTIHPSDPGRTTFRIFLFRHRKLIAVIISLLLLCPVVLTSMRLLNGSLFRWIQKIIEKRNNAGKNTTNTTPKTPPTRSWIIRDGNGSRWRLIFRLVNTTTLESPTNLPAILSLTPTPPCEPFIFISRDFSKEGCEEPEWNKAGVTVAGTGEPGSAPYQLYLPAGIYIDSHDNLYVADQGNNRVQMFIQGSTTGVTIVGKETRGSSNDKLDWPTDVSVDSNGDVLIADTLNSRIQKWIRNTTEVETAAKLVGKYLNEVFLFTDHEDQMYIAEALLNCTDCGRVIRHSRKTPFETKMLNDLRYPKGLYVDRCHNIYVTDSEKHIVEKYNQTSKQRTILIGSKQYIAGSKLNELNSPSDVILDIYGNVYVADSGNHRILRLSESLGVTVPIIGITSKADADARHLNTPYSVAFDSKWNIYVSDRMNSRIQRFDLINGDISC